MTIAKAPTVEVGTPCPAWQRDCPQGAALAGEAARLTLRVCHAPSATIVDITLADDATQRALNRTWRGRDVPTNVLAFPAGDLALPPPAGAPLLLGDVVVAFETVRREATEQDKPLADHLRHLVVHGVLHLLGYEHDRPADRAEMEAREIAILVELGVPDPYRDTM
jgi:probable rRNA maturation factor